MRSPLTPAPTPTPSSASPLTKIAEFTHFTYIAQMAANEVPMDSKTRPTAVPASEFVRNFGRYRMQAQREAVAVSSHGQITGYFIAPDAHEGGATELRHGRAERRQGSGGDQVAHASPAQAPGCSTDAQIAARMAVPPPEPGLVINYAYLWHYEHETGQEEGRKDRPSVIVLCVEEAPDAETVVTVLPITHRKPERPEWAVEIPLAVKRHLRLDDDPSWIVVAEGNEFVWPGYDLRQRHDGSYAFGFLPPQLFARVRRAFVALHRAGKTRKTPRD